MCNALPLLPVQVLLRAALLLAGLGLIVALAPPAGAEERPDGLRYTTPGPVPDLRPERRAVQGPRIRIGDHDVTPRTVLVLEGEQISWHSMSRAASVIVFEREVARSMVCHSLVNFSLVEDELRSAPLQPGETASFCELEPGTYRYRVVRSGHDAAQSAEAARRLEGWVVVRPARTSEDADRLAGSP